MHSHIARTLLLGLLLISSSIFELPLTLVSASATGADKIVLVAGGAEDKSGIPAIRATLKEPFGTAFDAQNNLWIIEMASGNRLLKVDTQGMLAHVGGQLEG